MFLFQSRINLERHSTSYCLDFKEKFSLRCKRKVSLDNERSRIGIQPSLRFWGPRCRCHGGFGQTVENGTGQVPLRSRQSCRQLVSVLTSFDVPNCHKSYNVYFLSQRNSQQSTLEAENRHKGLSGYRNAGLLPRTCSGSHHTECVPKRRRGNIFNFANGNKVSIQMGGTPKEFHSLE